MTTYYGSSKIHLTALNKGVFLLKLCVRYIDIYISVITGDAAICRMPLFFNLLKDLIISVMIFVDEEGNQPLRIAVGFYVNHGAADHHTSLF